MSTDDQESLETTIETIDPDRFEEILAQVVNDPMKVALKCQTALSFLELSHEKALNQTLAIGYAIAFQLKDRPEQLRRFTENNCWTRPIRKRPEGVKILQLVFRFIECSWGNGGSYKRSYNKAMGYAAGLAYYFENNMHPSQILSVIKASGGIENLSRSERAIRRSEKPGRKQPHRNGAIPRTIRDPRAIRALTDYGQPMVQREQAAIDAVEKFNIAFINFMRNQSTEDD